MNAKYNGSRSKYKKGGEGVPNFSDAKLFGSVYLSDCHI